MDLRKILSKLLIPLSLIFAMAVIGLMVVLYVSSHQVFNLLADYQLIILGALALVLFLTYIPTLKNWKPDKMVGRDESLLLNIRAKIQNSRRMGKRFARSWRGIIGVVIILFFAIVGLFPHWFVSDQQPQYSWMELRDMDRGPSSIHPLGLTGDGQDILYIVVHGTRPVISFALRAAIIAVAVGGVLGALAGYLGGLTERLFMVVSDTILAFPSLFIMMTVLTITGVHGHRLWLIAAYGIASTAKIVRAETLTLRQLDYTQAARAMGCSDLQVVFQHILVNATPVLIVQASLFSGQAVMFDAYINFLGVAGAAGWAGAVSTAVSSFKSLAVYREPWLVSTTGICLFMLISAFNLVGDALRDALDVKSA